MLRVSNLRPPCVPASGSAGIPAGTLADASPSTDSHVAGANASDSSSAGASAGTSTGASDGATVEVDTATPVTTDGISDDDGAGQAT